jgi:hypothetical protein
MSDKRPWTPSPWFLEGRTVYALQPNPRPRKGMPDEIDRWFAGFQRLPNGAPVEEVRANALLASKAPELAEFVIKFIKGSHVQEHFDAIMLLSDLLDEAQKLLKECGYESKKI